MRTTQIAQDSTYEFWHIYGFTFVFKTTMLSFKADINTMTVSEISTVTTIDNIKYTLYYTYDSITGEPAPHQMTSCGSSTDENAYYLDSEVVEWH